MRHGCWTIGLGMLLALGGGAAQAIDPFFPTFGNDGYDVQSYDLTLAVDPRINRLDGHAALVVRTLSRLDRLTLDLSHLTVKRVKVNGVPATFTHAGDKLRIRLPGTIREGARLKIAVSYGGRPHSIEDPTAPGADILGLGWTSHARSSYVVSEPVGAGTWYPVNDEPTDKATYRVAVTVPKPYTAVSNGILESTTDLGTDRRFVWKERQPMASYLAILDIDHYRLERSWARRALPIRTYTTAETTAETIAALRQTSAMLSLFEPLAGPYPFGSYGSVIVDDPELYYALETQAMSTFPAEGVDEATVAHELAHQWFGDAVTVENWRDLWLAEGFATYFEFIWAYRGNRPALDSAFQELYRYVVENEVGAAVVSRPEDLFADNTYFRGALTLQALRLRVGDEAFFRILKTFYRVHRYANASSGDFIEVAVRQGGQPGIRQLLRAWLYDQAVPPLDGAHAMAKAGDAPAALPFEAAATRRHSR
jgi:aminopeptidase N